MKTSFKLSTLVLVMTLTACGSGNSRSDITSQSIDNWLEVSTPDGSKINLELAPQGAINRSTNDGYYIGQKNNYSIYGVWQSHDKKSDRLSWQGAVSENIPSYGRATYKGDAIWISGYDKEIKRGGTSTLNVDFSQKTVDGSIKFTIFKGDELRRDITLQQGTLEGAQFSGQATVAGNSNGIYQGALLGHNASEMAGLVQFKNNSNLDVAFGGKKQ